MAAQTSRSNISADSYLGSLITLISKSEIRYEGILFNINTAESSIGLRNVRSFGTEGRKKDGPQLPPTDKVYEYILFRGSDIKDLQVKSSPPVQTTASIYNDPAIIQSHIPQESATSTSLSYTDTRSQQDLSPYASLGLPKSLPQSSVPMYQPGGNLGPWGSSYTFPTTNGSLPAQLHTKGIYGASDGLQPQQQSLLQPPPGLLTRPSVQQTVPFTALSAPLPSRASNVPTPPLLETQPPLLPSFSSVAPIPRAPLVPAQCSALPSDSSPISKPNKGSMQGLHSVDTKYVTPPTTVLEKNVFPSSGTVLPKSAGLMMSSDGVLESEWHVSDASGSFVNKGLTPSLVTPNQFLQPGPSRVSSFQSLQSVQKDVQMVQVSSNEQSLQISPDAQAPILPLPTSLEYKVHGNPLHNRQNNRGQGRGGGHWASHNVANFTEDFDFVSMNEKFNKDEVWGQLGKTNSPQDDGLFQGNDSFGETTSLTKPVYVKDDFFDSLSSNTSGGSQIGRSKFSEEMKLNTETFGNSARLRVGHGGRGYGRIAHGFSRGDRAYNRGGRSYDRDGYGYNRSGRGFGHGGQIRDSRNSGRSYGYNERSGWGHHAT